MANLEQKRKASANPESAPKRTRIEVKVEADQESDSVLSDNESEYESNGGFEDGPQVGTPLTQPSPGPKVFPSQLKTLKCTYEGCEKAFNRPVRLASHLRSHANERLFPCPYEDCEKSYIQDKHLAHHVKSVHLQERNHPCDYSGCSKAFTTATRLRRHQSAHAGRDRFRCTGYEGCEQTFRKHQTLQQHIRSEHLDLTPFPCTHIDQVTGVKCNAGFDQPGSLRKHEDRMHGAPRFFCEECTIPSSEGLPTPMGFTTKAQMDKHLRDKHINCPFCDQTFGSKAELHSHNENTHSEGSAKLPLAARKTFQCPYAGCDKSFTKNNNLNFHIRSIHEGRRFVCGQHDLQNSAATEGWNGEGGCGKECVSKANLEDHVRTQHMGLPSIINAGRVTYTRKARKARKEPSTVGLLTGKAYEEEQGRDILCTVDECPYRFTRPYDLKVHLRAKHHIDILDFDSDTDAEDPTYMEEMYSTAEDTFDRRESELREQAHFTDIENSNFWIGGTDSKLADRRDGEGEMWGMEEQEMRNLIDEASMPRHDGLEGLLDPALMALSAE